MEDKCWIMQLNTQAFKGNSDLVTRNKYRLRRTFPTLYAKVPRRATVNSQESEAVFTFFQRKNK